VGCVFHHLSARVALQVITWTLQTSVSLAMLAALLAQVQETLLVLEYVLPLVNQLQEGLVLVSNRQDVHQSAPHVMVAGIGIA